LNPNSEVVVDQILEALDSVSGNVLDFSLAGEGYVARG
jgi:hypothetical protein